MGYVYYRYLAVGPRVTHYQPECGHGSTFLRIPSSLRENANSMRIYANLNLSSFLYRASL